MSAKDHYDNFLGNIYSWMTGDFASAQAVQQSFFSTNGIVANGSKLAIDLGAGHGLQTISLAKLGFDVHAVDFNHQLLEELQAKAFGLPVSIFEDDLLNHLEHTQVMAAVIVCMGDTLTHLESIEQVETFTQLAHKKLQHEGKLVLSFRDLTRKLAGEQRFIPVRSDENRILTCFLEYFPERVMVHDIVHERLDGSWQQRISAYSKLRLDEAVVTALLERRGFRILSRQTIDRMIYLVAEK
jgi:SAM-dependent methyltransferase